MMLHYLQTVILVLMNSMPNISFVDSCARIRRYFAWIRKTGFSALLPVQIVRNSQQVSPSFFCFLYLKYWIFPAGAQTLDGRLFQLEISFVVLILAILVGFFHLKQETMDLKHTMQDSFARLNAKLDKMEPYGGGATASD